MALSAAIFDLDGTLVDNMRFHVQAWVAMSRSLGIETPAERFEREFNGWRNEEIFPALLGRPVPPEELARLSEHGELRLHSGSDTRVLLLAGRPLGEPIVQYGPFVMNSREEIEQALRDFRDDRLTA